MEGKPNSPVLPDSSQLVAISANHHSDRGEDPPRKQRKRRRQVRQHHQCVTKPEFSILEALGGVNKALRLIGILECHFGKIALFCLYKSSGPRSRVLSPARSNYKSKRRQKVFRRAKRSQELRGHPSVFGPFPVRVNRWEQLHSTLFLGVMSFPPRTQQEQRSIYSCEEACLVQQVRRSVHRRRVGRLCLSGREDFLKTTCK